VTHDVDEALYVSDRVVMMTNGPAATVGRIMDVELPRPRRRPGILDHPNYLPLRERMIAFLGEGAQEPESEGASEPEEDVEPVPASAP
jgi:ABC-type nitrate/sulfonate/bicarbonate transport system ATPase subunit